MNFTAKADVKIRSHGACVHLSGCVLPYRLLNLEIGVL